MFIILNCFVAIVAVVAFGCFLQWVRWNVIPTIKDRINSRKDKKISKSK